MRTIDELLALATASDGFGLGPTITWPEALSDAEMAAVEEWYCAQSFAPKPEVRVTPLV